MPYFLFSTINKATWKNRRLFSRLGLAVAVFLLASCASVPEPRGVNDTLLIFTMAQQMDVKAGNLYYLELKIDTMDEPIKLRPWEKFAMVSGLKPGEHYTTTLTIMYNPEAGWSTTGNKPKPQPFVVPFVVKPGACTIFPVKFIYIMKVDSTAGTGSSSWDMKQLDEEDMEKELEALKGFKNFERWKN